MMTLLFVLYIDRDIHIHIDMGYINIITIKCRVSC